MGTAEAEAEAGAEAGAREVAARWKSFGLWTVLGSVGAAVFPLKWMLFCSLPGVIAIARAIVTPGEDEQLARLLGVVLGSVGAVVLGLPCWVLSWIVPIVGFITLETWKPVLLGEPILLLGEPILLLGEPMVLLGVERGVLIVGVVLLGLKWMLASPVVTVVIVAAIVSESVELVVKVGSVRMALLDLKWGLAILGLNWGSAVRGLKWELAVKWGLAVLFIPGLLYILVIVVAIAVKLDDLANVTLVK